MILFLENKYHVKGVVEPEHIRIEQTLFIEFAAEPKRLMLRLLALHCHSASNSGPTKKMFCFVLFKGICAVALHP
jgi:hypothetical protein